MNHELSNPDDGVSRRSVLAATAAGLVGSTGGCIDRVQSVVDQDGDDQLSLSIMTVPADGDRESVQIARQLEANLEAVGVDVTVSMRSRSEFLEAVLIEHDFDLYVGRHPADFDPDFLYEALHSTYANEAGWQNPFGFTSMAFDSSLETQRRADGQERATHVASVLNGLAQEKPFEPICIPSEYRVARTDRFDGWEDDHLATRLGYLGLESGEGVDRLHALVTDARPSQNVNPLSATIRERGTVIDVLYDSLATVDVTDDTTSLRPWLAADWEWNDSTATVTLREGCRFHDGEPVTAADVAFTYRFLADTTLGRGPVPSPAPRYRGQVAAIDDIEVVDDRRLTVSVTSGQEVGERAFTVPILPEHVWRERVESRIGRPDEFSPPQGKWGVVTTDNVPPVGSGPFQFAARTEREHMTLERFDEHFTLREDVSLPEPTVEELRFGVDPGTASSIERVAGGEADVTTSMLETYALEEIPDAPEIERLESPSWTFYHVGFNTRKTPFSNSHFRRAVARLLDKEWLVESVFHGHATPVTAPVADEWVPDSLVWDGEDPVTPFVGSGGDLDVEAARAAFEAAGFRYDSDGRLLGQY
ncbi:ABC transporter substrate-binding protein [Halopiger djelfimassiliensis]|uniref:ABC transporter substrate-binding protein n=1 Tax=Halopiger djelfimassiliensis TaxID=1293047 RepID=UPI00067810E8|nr:ABC transporter substrate-binding protein [Halopiger djelfimassiliensis]